MGVYGTGWRIKARKKMSFFKVGKFTAFLSMGLPDFTPLAINCFRAADGGNRLHASTCRGRAATPRLVLGKGRHQCRAYAGAPKMRDDASVLRGPPWRCCRHAGQAPR